MIVTMDSASHFISGRCENRAIDILAYCEDEDQAVTEFARFENDPRFSNLRIGRVDLQDLRE